MHNSYSIKCLIIGLSALSFSLFGMDSVLSKKSSREEPTSQVVHLITRGGFFDIPEQHRDELKKYFKDQGFSFDKPIEKIIAVAAIEKNNSIKLTDLPKIDFLPLDFFIKKDDMPQPLTITIQRKTGNILNPMANE